MKILLKKQLRDLAKSPVAVSVFVITALGVFLFAGLWQAAGRLARGIDDFYRTSRLADYTVAKKLNADELRAVQEEFIADGALEYEAVTIKVGEVNRNALVSFVLTPELCVNVPYISDGYLPREDGEALIDSGFALANGVKVGDSIFFVSDGTRRDVTIVGIAVFPEHLYKGDDIPQIAETAILKVLDRNVAELNALYLATPLAEKDVRRSLGSITGKNFEAARVLGRDKNVSVARIGADVGLINSLVSIIPTVCMIALCMILFVNMSKRAEDESYTMGVLEANGLSGSRVFAAYAAPYLAIVVLSATIGAVLGVIFMPKLYVAALSRFYTLPPLGNKINFVCILVPLIVLVAATLGSLAASMAWALRSSPSALMRGKVKKSVSVLKSARLPLTLKLSVRNFLSYTRKTVLTVVSATLCLGLLVTAFAMDNSVTEFGSTVYGKWYNYNVTLQWNGGDGVEYNDIKGDMEASGLFSDMRFCLEFPADELNSGRAAMVSVIDGEDPCYDLYDGSRKIEYGDEGVYIPRSYGDIETVALMIYAEEPFTLELPVAGSFSDMGTFGVIIPTETLRKRLSPDVYLNAYLYLTEQAKKTEIYATAERASQLDDFVRALEDKYSAAFLLTRHDMNSPKVRQLFAVINITEALLFVICGLMTILLIFNISCLSITDRIRDYKVFKALGVNSKTLTALNSLENYFSMGIAFALSIPTGLAIANAVIAVVRRITGVAVYLGMFVSSAFALLACALLFTAISNVFINKKISRVNIALALKTKE